MRVHNLAATILAMVAVAAALVMERTAAIIRVDSRVEVVEHVVLVAHRLEMTVPTKRILNQLTSLDGAIGTLNFIC